MAHELTLALETPIITFLRTKARNRASGIIASRLR